jgi:hypothetical protein
MFGHYVTLYQPSHTSIRKVEGVPQRLELHQLADPHLYTSQLHPFHHHQETAKQLSNRFRLAFSTS